MKSFFIMLAAAGMMLAAGCFGVRYRQTGVYDLAPGKVRQPAAALRFGGFRNLTPVDLNMIYRTGPVTLELDPYNRWAQSPGDLLARYFRNCYGGSGEAVLELRGTITDFSLDFAELKARLGLEWKITAVDGGAVSEFRTVVEQPMAAATPADGAQAMSRCAAAAAEQLDRKLALFASASGAATGKDAAR